jgi:hypothetical protein
MVKNSWLKTGIVASLAALGIVSVTATTASAWVACNRFGECWHVKARWTYPVEAGIVFHRDGWRFNHPGWRWVGDREDRGYWRHGVWVTF